MSVKTIDCDYTLIFDKSVMGEESLEQLLQDMKSKYPKSKVKVKTIQAGNNLDADVYPIWVKSKDTPRMKKKELSPIAMSRYNEKTTINKFIGLINENFSDMDIRLDLTYPDKYLPNKKRAERDMQNFIRRIMTYRKKNNLPDLKYVYVIEYVDDDELETTKKIRIHHHMIMSGMDRDAAEDIWKKCIKNSRCQAERLQPDDFGLEGIARYLTKKSHVGKTDQKFKKRWVGSKNLKKPKVNKSTTKLSMRKLEKVAKEPEKFEETFEKMYKNRYKFLKAEVYYSERTTGYYIRVKMKKRTEKELKEYLKREQEKLRSKGIID